MRADRDVGALIISQMIQRLAIADLVVADITLANANVYYEVGVRHAAKETGLRPGGRRLGAAGLRPRPDARVAVPASRRRRRPDETAETARAALREDVAALVGGVSPVFDAVPGLPDVRRRTASSAFADAVAELSEFEAEIRAVRAAPDDAAARTACERCSASTATGRPSGDARVDRATDRWSATHLGLHELLAYIAALPAQRREAPDRPRAAGAGAVEDRRQPGRDRPAAAADRRPTARRRSGSACSAGGYKDLYRKAQEPKEKRRYLR